MADAFDEAIRDIVIKVVGACGGDLDRVAAIAKANVISGRVLTRLVLIAQTDMLVLDRVTLTALIADVRGEEESVGDNN